MPKARHGQHVGDSHGRHGVIESIIGHVAQVVWKDGSTSLVPTDALHQKGKGGCWPLCFLVVALSLGVSTGAGAWLL